MPALPDSVPKADNDPGSPTSLGYASSEHDHASAGSGFFSRTSSGTSHSSHPEDLTTADVVAFQDAPLDTSPTSPTATSRPVLLSSGEQGPPHSPANAPVREGTAHRLSSDISAGVESMSHLHSDPHFKALPSSSAPSPPPAPPHTQSELDLLKARGEKIPEHVFALRSDTTVEMLRLATDIQKHIAGVEQKVDGHDGRFNTVEEHLGNIQRTVDGFQRTVERRLDSVAAAVNRGPGDEVHGVIDNELARKMDDDVLVVLKQSLEKHAKVSADLLKQQLDASTKALEQRLDASAQKRLAAFQEEMSESFAQLKEDVGDQIREELGGEQRKYDSTLALQAFAEDAVENTYDAVVRQVGQLSKAVDKLQKHLPSASPPTVLADHAAPTAPGPVSVSTPAEAALTTASTTAPTAPGPVSVSTPAEAALTTASTTAPITVTAPPSTPVIPSANPTPAPTTDEEHAPQIGVARPIVVALVREVMRIATKLRRDLGKH